MDCHSSKKNFLKFNLISSNSRGFSLVELITSLVMISILAMGLFATNLYAKKIEFQNRDKVQAAAIVESEILKLRQTGAQNLTPGTTTRETTKNIDGLAGTVTIQVIAAQDHEEDKFVRVRFDWDGGAHSEALGTYLFQE